MQGQFTSPPPSEFLSSVDVLVQQFGAAMFVLLIAAAIFSSARTGRSKNRRLRWKPRVVSSHSSRATPITETDKVSALERARTRDFSRKNLFNKSEEKIFRLLRDEIGAYGTSLNLMAQVSLREMVNTDDKYVPGGGWYALTDLRTDFAIIDNAGGVIAAIEFHGTGHNLGDAHRRDETKRLILEKAGIPLLVVRHGETPSILKNRLAELLASCGLTKSAATTVHGAATQ